MNRGFRVSMNLELLGVEKILNRRIILCLPSKLGYNTFRLMGKRRPHKSRVDHRELTNK